MNMNSGYYGYSMSERALQAYECGEKPVSKWTKTEIIDAIKKCDPPFSIGLFSKLPLQIIKSVALYRSSWHHTSEYCNRTDFYSIDYDKLEGLTNEKIQSLLNQPKQEEPAVIRIGSISYLEWTGTRKHPKATERKLENVIIAIKGSFYIVSDDSGAVILKKKIGSTGTVVRWQNEKR